MAKNFTYNDVSIKQAALIIQKITQHVEEKEWSCLYPDCTQTCINSHVLQRRGILNHISKSNTLIQFSPTSAFEQFTNPNRYCFKTRTVNKAMSAPLFCKKHDSDIFKRIEQSAIDFFDYKSQLLFSYRGICAEIRKKQILIETDSRGAKSKLLASYYDYEFLQSIEENVKANKLGIQDLEILKKNCEDDLINESNSFVFKTYLYQPIEVCASAIFTPFSASDEFDTFTREVPYPSCIINLIPQEGSLNIIVGYHSSHVNDWIKAYIDSLSTSDRLEQELIISNLIATRINSFALSKDAYVSIKREKLQSFLEYWDDNYDNLNISQSYRENLFS